MKKWSVAQLNKERAMVISQKYGFPMILATLLDIRGIVTDEQISEFMSDDFSFFDPMLCKDMDKAVSRIKLAIETGERICVYGDFDADGVTATALLFQYLEALGADVTFYIPSRSSEGYGMNNEAVEHIADDGVKLIITVDNGVSASEQVEYAASLGIDTVITDHHSLPEVLPHAAAIVDLHQPDCNSVFKELSGVGVAFKLVMAIEGEFCDTERLLDNYADLAALGTIGDVVSLTGENRTLVKQGIMRIQNGDRAGIAALRELSGSDNAVTAGELAYTVVPRINAGGRLGLSEKSVRLLITDDETDAHRIAAELTEDNQSRKQIEKDILDCIDKKIRDNPLLLCEPVIILDGEDWHQGVIGIVAARVKSIYGKPCIIISRDGDTARGSGRSIPGFSLCDAVFSCSELLIHYGGHPLAVGFSLNCADIDAFCDAIYDYTEKLGTMPLPEITLDCKLNPALLDISLVDSIGELEPFGAGNRLPVFGLYNMRLESVKPLSNGKHQRLTLSRGDTRVTAMCFGCQSSDFAYSIGDVIDLAVELEKNRYNRNEYLSIIVREIRFASCDTRSMLLSARVYERFVTGREITREQAQSILPNREAFSAVYRALRGAGEYRYSLDILAFRLGLDYGLVLTAVHALSELGLVEYSRGLNSTSITVNDTGTKVDINSAPVIGDLKEVCG